MNVPLDLVQDSQTQVTAADLAQVNRETELEFSWHLKTPRFQTNLDIQEAFQKGELVQIGLTENYRPISRFLNPDTNLQYPPYLNERSKQVLDEITVNWRSKVTQEFGNECDNVLVPITFFVCSEEYVQALKSTPGKIISDQGTHSTGFTFDLDASSYYLKEGDEFSSVTDPRRNPDIIKSNKDGLIKVAGSALHTKSSNQIYNQRITDLLVEAALESKVNGKANVIVEYEGTQNRCLHICAKP
jgi:hypothetical protein